MALSASLCFSVSVSAAEKAGSQKIADIDPVEIGKAGIGTKGLFDSDVKQDEARVFFAPRTNTILLECKAENLKVRLQLTQEGRSDFIAAVRQYNRDYDARSLNVRTKKTNDLYGRSSGGLEWGSFSLTGKAEPRIRYGYVFIDRKKPYFTLSLNEAPNLGEQHDDISVDDNSPALILYFTKKQATALGEMLMQDNLVSILKEQGVFERTENDEDYVPKAE